MYTLRSYIFNYDCLEIFILIAKPIIGNYREVYSAESGKPVTVKVDFYAYPHRAAAVVMRTDYSPLYSENITKIFQKKNNLRFMKKGLTYHSEGETIYWKIDRFNESDYGMYAMILENDVGIEKIYFSFSSKGNNYKFINIEPCRKHLRILRDNIPFLSINLDMTRVQLSNELDCMDIKMKNKNKKYHTVGMIS